MGSDNLNSPETGNSSFFKRNSKLIGAIFILVVLISSLYVISNRDGGIDADFARNNAFLPEQNLQHWYISYFAGTGLYNFEISEKVSETEDQREYSILGNDDVPYTLILYCEEEEVNGLLVDQWYAELKGENVSSPPEEIDLFFEIISYVQTDPFTAIPETVSYHYLDHIYLLFGAWEEAGIENQQLAYGMADISKAVGNRIGDIDKISIAEISDQHFIDIYKKKIGTPAKPVIYVMTEPHGAMKNNLVMPYDGVIIVEIPQYQDIRLFCLLIGEIIAPSGGTA